MNTMMNVQFGIVAEATLWQQLINVFTTPSLQLFLLLGSILLVISLMLLTMTRLGHARPITKCIVLSVIAHVLLLGYAYGTRMIFQVPVAEKQEPISVHIEGVDDEELALPEPVENITIDEFAMGEIEIETEPLERPQQEITFDLERETQIDNTISATDESDEPVAMAMVQEQKPNFNIEEPNIEFSELDSPVPSDQAPESIHFERLGEAEGDVVLHEPDFKPPTNDLRISNEIEDVEFEPSILQPGEDLDREIIDPNESDLFIPEPDASIANEFVTPEDRAIEFPEENAAGKNTDSLSGAQVNSAPVESPRRLGDGLEMPPTYQLRTSMNRTAAALANGGSEKTEAAVNRALEWLAGAQHPDGRWCPKQSGAGREDKVFGHDRGGCGIEADSGLTGLAILSFLGAGHTHLEGPYQANVQKGLEYLIRNQAENGDLSGNAKLFARMYCHSMSLLALSEALAISGDRRLHRAVEVGVEYSVAAQDKQGGGWRYQPGDEGDMSQLGWQVMALNAARQAGIETQPATQQRMIRFLASCRAGTYGGLASYRPHQGPSTTMTAESLVCRSFLNVTITDEELAEAEQRILSELPDPSRVNLYYWYYATLALQQRDNQAWQRWNQELQRVLLSQQQLSGDDAGSWEPVGLWGGYGGQVYSTALATLSLEVYYRYQTKSQELAGRNANVDTDGQR